jgi:predicted regulator of Ras-like GTPase activity (Roadblock/LC7/MglB family)
MYDIGAVENTLGDLSKTKGIDSVVLISRSGMHIAGKVPKGAHTETFSAMFAILLGAAETATSELSEKLDHVVLNVEGSRMLVMNNGPKALFVLKLADQTNEDEVINEVTKCSEKLEELL